MNKLLITVQTANLVKLLLDKILHGLDIVVRGLLYLLHAGSILLTEIAVDITETVKDTVVEISKLRQWELTESDEILYLHTHTVSDKGIF